MATNRTPLYRGEPLPRLNEHELSTGQVQTQTVTVYELSNVPRADLELDDHNSHFGKSVYDIAGADVSSREVSMTPGFTPNVGTAVFFSHYGKDVPGLVFAFDGESIPGVKPIEYDIEFADENEGIAARVDTLSKGEIRFRGEVVGLTDKREEVWQWGPEARNVMDTSIYSDEAEWFTYQTGISVLSGLEAVASYVGTAGYTSGALDTTLAWFDGYAPRRSYHSDIQGIEYMETEEKLEAYYQEVRREMNRLGDRLVVVLIEDQGRIGKQTDGLRDRFVMARTPDGITRDPNDPHLHSGRVSLV